MFDCLISGGTVIDGTEEERYCADLAIRDGRIAALGNLTGAQAHRCIDASGKLVTPGLIAFCGEWDSAKAQALCPQMLAQGVTTLCWLCSDPEEPDCTGSPFPVHMVFLSAAPTAAEDDAAGACPEDVIRSQTSLAAQRLGLHGKGKLIPGLDADLCVFASEDLTQGPELVMVGGRLTAEDGTHKER